MNHSKMCRYEQLHYTPDPVPIRLPLYHLFRFACPSSVLRYCAPYQLVLLPSALSHFPSLSLFRFFLLSHCRWFLGEASWFGKVSLSMRPPPHSLPLPSTCSSSPTLDHVMRNRAPRERSLGRCVGLCLYSVTFLPVEHIYLYIDTCTYGPNVLYQKYIIRGRLIRSGHLTCALSLSNWTSSRALLNCQISDWGLIIIF